MSTTTTKKNPTVKGKTGKVVDYSEGPTPQVTAINKARAQNIADGKDVYSGGGAKGQVGGGSGGGSSSDTGPLYEPGTEGQGPDGKGIPIRNYEQQNPYGYYGTKDNQFPGTPGNPNPPYTGPGGYEPALISEGIYKGLTPAQAAAKQKQQAGQVSSLTSFSFDPATVSGAKKTFQGFNAKLSDINNDPWASKGTKKDKAAGLYESTANEYAKLFNTADQFDSLLQTDGEFAANIEAFKRAGGDVNSIRNRIGASMQAPQADPALEARRATWKSSIDGLVAQGVKDPQQIADSLNEAGKRSGVDSNFTAQEVTDIMTGQSNQSTPDYLASLSTSVPAGASGADKQAMDELVPERELAQAEVSRIANIPQQYKDLYFGTPDSIGILQEKRIQAEEQKKIIEKKEKNDETSLRAKADLAIDKNNADMEIESAQIEENRLAARNYATGMLAKLGALNTTGAAVVKLQVIEQKYNQQSQQLRTTTRFANQSIEVNLKSAINDVEVQRDQDILDVQTDLTKDKETVMKEVQKLEQDSAAKIYSITDKAAGELRANTVKYREKAKALAEKNAKASLAAASSYDLNGVKILSSKEQKKKDATMTNEVEDAVTQLRSIVKDQNFYGVNPDDYNQFEDYFLQTYGSKGVAALKKAMKDLDLEVDQGGDGKPDK